MLGRDTSNVPLTFSRGLLWVLVVAVLLRLGFYVVYPALHFPDAIAYRTIGQEIFAGQIITNDIYMPLYPIITFLSGGGVGLILVDILFSVVTVAVIYWLAETLFKQRTVALLSAAAAAVYPHFLFYAITGLTETLFTLLLLIGFLLLYRGQMMAAIVVLVLSIMVRPSLDLLNPVLIVLFTIGIYRQGVLSGSKNLLLYFVVYALLMSPWWMHQYEKYGTFVRLNLGDGIVLYSGNNPMNRSGGGIVGDDLRMDDFVGIEDPVERNNVLKQAAIDYMVANPQHIAELAVTKFIRFWRLWPYTEKYQQWYTVAVSLLSYGVVLLLAIGFVLRSGFHYFRTLLPILALFGYLTLVHMVTIGSIRYRFPLEPFLIIFAAHFVAGVGQRSRWLGWLEQLGESSGNSR